VRDQASQPYKTTRKTAVLCILILVLLDSMGEVQDSKLKGRNIPGI
jgi:hypothetical protein